MCTVHLGGWGGAGYLADIRQQISANEPTSKQWKAQCGDPAVPSQPLAEAKLSLSSCRRASQLCWLSTDVIVLVSQTRQPKVSEKLSLSETEWPWPSWWWPSQWLTSECAIDRTPCGPHFLCRLIVAGSMMQVPFLKSLSQRKTDLLAQTSFGLLGLLWIVTLYTDCVWL